MANLDIIAANNVVKYILAVEKSEKWIAVRIGVSEDTFIHFLTTGKKASSIIPKLNKLFRVNKPNYFYELDFKPPKSFAELEATSTLDKRVCLSDKGTFNTKSFEFKETMEVMEDLMNITHILKSAKEIG